MKSMIVIVVSGILLGACNGRQNSSAANLVDMNDRSDEKISTPGGEPAMYDTEKGIGKFTHVDVGNKLDVTLANNGEKIYGIKCANCHSLSNEKLIGPGLKDVTNKYKPEWIMNFITNTNEMIDKDTGLQKQSAMYKLRMPDQNIQGNEARDILEYMRKNDGVK